MTRPELFIMKSDFSATVRMPHVSDIMHPHFRVSKNSPHLATDELLQQYMNEPLYCDYYVNLSPYINDSGVCVLQHFSLHRAYTLFRTMGLRQMTVVNHTNQVVGTISRKDLMGFAIEERLEKMLKLLKDDFGELKVKWYVFECCGERVEQDQNMKKKGSEKT